MTYGEGTYGGGTYAELAPPTATHDTGVQLVAPLDEPWFQGSSTGALVPGKYHCLLNGRPYMIDLQSGQFTRKSVPLIRQQADAGPSPTETSLNPEGLWRRSVDTWHKGAGQAVYDRADSDPARFSTSKGVDPWTRWELSLLNATDRWRHTPTVPVPLATVADGHLYFASGNDLHWTLTRPGDSPAFEVVADGPTADIQDMTTDGQYVYITDGSDIYRSVIGDTTMAVWNTLDCQRLMFVKGRLLAANDFNIYDVVDAGVPDPLEVAATIPGNFRWIGFAEGDVALYAAGFSGDKSRIFRSVVKDDGSGLDVFLPAASLPDGEIVRSIVGYLGFVLIGSDLGVRFASADTEGNLTLGSLIPTSYPVRCFEPQDRFVWYGLSNYDDTSTGLGRIDLSTFIDINTPAYASDVMADTQGEILTIVTYEQTRVFTVAGDGLWIETDATVASGTLETGKITYRLPDPKVAVAADVRATGGTVAVAVKVDGDDYRSLGTRDSGDISFTVGRRRGLEFGLRVTLAGDVTLRTVTLRAYPAAKTVDLIEVPLLLHEQLATANGATEPCNISLELAELQSLRNSRTVVAFQTGDQADPVIVEDYVFTPYRLTDDGRKWNGTALVQLKVIG